MERVITQVQFSKKVSARTKFVQVNETKYRVAIKGAPKITIQQFDDGKWYASSPKGEVVGIKTRTPEAAWVKLARKFARKAH